MNESDLERDLEELGSAEDFLEYFGVGYDPGVVQVNRLHILQRFHDYLDEAGPLPQDEAQRRAIYAGLLSSAYSDFVVSDARTEKVFKVFRMHQPVSVEVPLVDLVPHVPVRAA